MKRSLLTMLLLSMAGFVFGQTTYYWVGAAPGASNTNINNNSNWNTVVDGTGLPRPSSTGASDILVFDGTNLGGATPVTGPVTVSANTSITCAQIRFINNVTINLVRPTGGTSTITISGEAGDDFVIEAGSALNIPISTSGSIRFAMNAANSGIVSGSLSMITAQQCRIDNTSSGSGSLRFTNGSSLTTNITSASSSYAFGSSSQSAPNWVKFEAGSHLYFEGGYSPHGSGSLFSAIDMQPGSYWHHRGAQGGGNFFNRQSYGNVIVENNATLSAAGSIYRIENLTVTAGSTFTTHSSGQTVVLGDLLIDGTLDSPAGSTNELVLGGNAAVSGTGTIIPSSLVVCNGAETTFNRDITVSNAVNIFGKVNFKTYRVDGAATFAAIGPSASASISGTLVAGSYLVTGTASAALGSQGKQISGPGIGPGTSIVSFSGTGDTIYLSKPALASGSGVSLTAESTGATLQNNNAGGHNATSGTIIVSGNQTYDDGINYIIDAATSEPFGVTTGSAATPVNAEFLELNAHVTVNRSITLSGHLTLNGKLTLRPGDRIRLTNGALVNGTPGTNNYIATSSNASTGELSYLQVDGISSAFTFPVGTPAYYLPVTISPSAVSDFEASVFEGITTNGAVDGAALTALQKQTVVDAVWRINRLSGSGDAGLQLDWDPALEGSTFTTLPNSDIGLIMNTGSSWALPSGSGDNTANSVNAIVSGFGSFSAGAVPQVDPFVFNPIPAKIYGDPDFNGGATSLNTTQPIVYTSSDPAVATIVNGDIHITGAGTATITASQATDGFYPAASVDQPITVAKADLTITADDELKFEGQPNPPLTATYTGFAYGETPSVLLTPAVLTTTATASSAPGTYPITVSGATATNYNVAFVSGTMTVQAKQNQVISFAALPAKTYGNADFAVNATSTNTTIPVTFNSSNPAVATINAGGVIHITGGGTTTITASQAGNEGYFPAPDVPRTLTVNRANLTVRVLDTVKVQGNPNPDFTIVYTGFVLGETQANLTAPATVNTIATATSPAGYYSLTPEGVVTNNYNVTYTAGRLTIYPPDGTGTNHLHAFMTNSSTLNVRIYSTSPALGDVTLYDLTGKPLKKKNVFMPEGFINATLDVSSLPSGLYVVTVIGGDVELKKIIPIVR